MRAGMLATLLLAGTSQIGIAATPAPAPQAGEIVLPRPAQPFKGVIGKTYADSTPAYPEPVKAPAGAPNILLVLTDDVGFAAAGTFGGPIPTPNLDRLAKQGLRYNRFHTTAMCSPTRAALLTGRNHHAVGTGLVTDVASGYPGYFGVIPRSAATIAEVLRQNGYNTAFFGKHHNLPNGEMSAAGPFDNWPTGLGFEYFYGFLGGDTNQWSPKLYRGTSPVEAPQGKDATLDKFLVDDAINWLHNQTAAAPDKPFLMYLAPGSAHAPHQAPKEWIARFKGQFDGGWDRVREETLKRQKAEGIVPANAKLTPRPAAIPAWDSLSADQRKVYARMMEVYAAMLAYQDAQIGRLLDELERTGKRDNTLVMFIEGDNGSSPEGELEGTLNELGVMANRVPEDMGWKVEMLDEMGGPNSYQGYPVGWGWALDTPFQWTKQVASHLGGTRNGLVVSWPARIKGDGSVRSQFAHVIDVAPTIYEAVGIAPPDIVNGARQQKIDGISMAYSFEAPRAPERHQTQYFEMIGNRAIYDKGWMASTTPARLPWQLGGSGISPMDYKWELYDLNRDFSQANDLAAKQPARLEKLKALWMEEAVRNNVLPLDDRQGTERAKGAMRPADRPRASYDYWGNGISVAHGKAPPLGLSSFTMEADVIAPEGGLNGVLVTNGSRFGGWSFYFDKGRPIVVHALSQQARHLYRIAAETAVPVGPVKLRYDFDLRGRPGQGGTMRISVNGQEVARGEIPRTVYFPAGLGETFDTGRDTGATVVDYPGGDALNGEIRKIHIGLR